MQAAERLLKQGKVQAALTELQRASENAPDDLLTLNRLGDLLARQGRSAEAIGHYRKIAVQFADGGFLPKSVAIHKKILRIDPNNLESLLGLGELYLTQELHGEARNYLLHAANQHIEAKNFKQAREVYEKLVDAEPDEPRHRVRLAETRAAEGDSDGAGEELIELGRALLTRGAIAEAERVYNRASELLPNSHGPLLGLSECLVADGREDEALSRLESAAAEEPPPAPVCGELAWHYAQNGRSEEALTLIRKTDLLAIGVPTWLKLFGLYSDRGDAANLWTELDPLFNACEKTNAVSLADLFEQLVRVEEQGHLPALERLCRVQMRRGETEATVRALESLVTAYQARSMNKEAKSALLKLEELAPASRAVEPAPTETPVESPAPPVAAKTPSRNVRGAVQAGRPSDDLPIEAEAPAVPLNRTDEEFVAGRLTQADVLEKYGLQPQALEQAESVTARFPGHVPAQEKRVALLRAADSGGDATRIAEALAGLALARRAAGDNPGAVEAALEASNGELRQHSLQLLQQCRLIEVGSETAPAAAPDEPPIVPTALETPTAEVQAETVATSGVTKIEPTTVQDESAGDSTAPDLAPRETAKEPGVDLVISFDGEPASDTPVAELPGVPVLTASDPAPTATASIGAADVRSTSRVPGPDMLEEIGGYIASGSLDEASRRIEALRALGYASEALEELGSRIESVREAETPAAAPGPAATREEDLDLSAIEAVLNEELLESEAPVVPEEDPEQSLEEVFSSFKAAVAEQVDDDDYGTHYDLGIAYKEMGLVDEAIAAFELSEKAPGFKRRSCTMIGLCYWEQQELDAAAEWYRKAIKTAQDEKSDTLSHLRYDLGEVLLQSGDSAGALTEFRDVAQIDPNYREVSNRVSELEEQLQT